VNNPDNHFRRNDDDDPTTNVTLQVLAGEDDRATWNTMDEGTFQLLERILAVKGTLEYWHGAPDNGTWTSERPPLEQRRVAGLVHESSTLALGAQDDDGVVGSDYRPYGVENVHITGGGLWPSGGSWNPTMTMVALAQDLADQLSGTTPSGADASMTDEKVPVGHPA
jgi:choline dehydrogenase-like flavoprotein